MRAMWRVHGKPGGGREGYVDRPYTMQDAEARLAEVSGDAAFAREFFARYIQGHDVPDYARLLARAGLVLRKQNPGRASWGDVRLDAGSGAPRLMAAPPSDSPLYLAGLDLGDELRDIDGARISSIDDANAVLRRHRPGDRVIVGSTSRSGASNAAAIVLVEDPRLELVPIDAAGGRLTAEQKAFRADWLGPRP